ncbi:HAMP domain-containing sensor histidine kinase [Paenibacillus thermoaerophilus]|uniref:histidine kinase n=1 Tax=Paenibacillus thermoaerophilus TaxID=1215385 RepID=A0ABW2V1A2_9BACL|nr:sensor histidine kinase [Paenibacillus thermoaerophilus]TMV18477.1 sensor histidine kinase [Paenibacillus thermoaerophilus]
MIRQLRNVLLSPKWQLIGYFLLAQIFPAAACIAFWLVFGNVLTPPVLIGTMVVIGLTGGLMVGYMASRNIQRKLDVLHLAFLQVDKGKFSIRIPLESGDPFEQVYADFNNMAESLESKARTLQKVSGEQNVAEAETAETAVLEERKRLARDLHDTVSQQLFALHLSASSLEKLLERGDLSKSQGLSGQLVRLSHQAQQQIRGLIAQLRPLELEGRSLREALEKWFPDFCRQNGLQGMLQLHVQDLADAVEHQLFRIIQEAMANIVKHAQASRVELSLAERDSQIVLQLTDDGKGFVSGTAGQGRYGLSSMRERAEKLGGQFELLSRPGSGTRVEVRVPLFASIANTAEGETGHERAH